MSGTRRVLLALSLASLVFLAAFVAVQLRLRAPTITTVSLFLVSGWLLAPLARRLQKPAVLVTAVLALPFLLLPLLWVVAGVSSHLINSWRLSSFATQFVSSPPTEATARVVSSEVGLLTGNGNHCDFEVSIALDNVSDAEAAVRHYEALPVESAIPGSSAGIQLRLASENPLVLIATDAPNEPAFDLRCH